MEKITTEKAVDLTGHFQVAGLIQAGLLIWVYSK